MAILACEWPGEWAYGGPCRVSVVEVGLLARAPWPGPVAPVGVLAVVLTPHCSEWARRGFGFPFLRVAVGLQLRISQMSAWSTSGASKLMSWSQAAVC